MRHRAGITIAISVFICCFLDNIIFANYTRGVMHPDMLLAMAVPLGIATGGVHSALICGGAGLLADVLFAKTVGIDALIIFLTGMLSGIFFRKFYTDNWIFPAVVALIAGLLKEHVFVIITAVKGIDFNYFSILWTYILPSALLTGAVAIPFHLCYKKLLDRYGKYLYEKRTNIL